MNMSVWKTEKRKKKQVAEGCCTRLGVAFDGGKGG